MALGAEMSNVLTLVIRQGMTPVSLGLGLGVVVASGLTRIMKGMLFGISTADPLTYVFVMAFLALVALLACWIPARRAARVDPMAALREE
jgi:ABC-type antimicrobial peptide transport system permease subunit